ncbi:hypothetical protein HCH_03358 [Hahella chejuensis KCTC 2396]|uniref:Uncharacterized protein n=1 Tax=Hahella chejuensis (strain KCTC 2396) TaxID=349521 RepID=Q2SGW2_HAHCH|nr:hypothetical protein [Hahella chejuensis]ABC30112.1 hypothetical protein HCH_03358 [Hahella chejuensis KCTC 2396]
MKNTLLLIVLLIPALATADNTITFTGDVDVSDTLTVDGDIKAGKDIKFSDGTKQSTAADNFPSGTIVLTLNSSCPDGWNDIDDSLKGRFVVITPDGGTVKGTVGDSMDDLSTPQHTHKIDESTRYGGGSRTASRADETDEASDGWLPYVQLNACVKQ